MQAKHPRPAWLIGAVLGASVFGALGVAGCARLGGELSKSAFASRFRSAPPAESAAGMQLTSGVMPRLGFAADTPVEQLLKEGDRPLAMNGLCPPDMASIDDHFCVDKYEASLVEALPSGEERAWPYYLPVEGHTVRAVSQRGVYPQGYISGTQAAAACRASGKRLCKPSEWRTACKGPEKRQFGYGDEHRPGTCNDNGKSPMGMFYGHDIANGTAWVYGKMNDTRLNQTPGTLAETGSHEDCTNGYGVYDMVGNLHEWVDDPAGTFQGGYYLDVTQNGDGCGYRTDAHEFAYHDYSTGFRCCADVAQ